jgi:serine protease Do
MTPGRTVRLTVVRDGTEREYSVTLGEQPADRSESAATSGGTTAERALDGVSLETLTPELARQFGISTNTKGVLVRRIDRDSAAAQAGLEQGDVIVEVNRQPVNSIEQVNRLLQETTTGNALLFMNRNGRTLYVAIPTK